MFHPGLVSVSFRALAPEEIVRLAADAGLQGIEWGGDVHVPCGDLARARAVGERTQNAGLAVAAYGSYCRLGGADAAFLEAAETALDTAAALGAPTVRFWAGDTASASVSEAQRAQIAKQALLLRHMAADRGLTAVFECHRGTLTDDYESARSLLLQAGGAHLGLCWQPNESRTPAYNLRAAAALAPYTAQLHVFHWPDEKSRRPLSEGAALWRDYFAPFAADGRDRWCLLEFMPDDDPASLPREASALRDLLAPFSAGQKC